MSLEDLLQKNKPVILEKWFHLILDSYPADTAKFLKSQKNRFANPVGHAISKGIEDLFEGLLKDEKTEAMSAFLENVVRVRAVQNFSPAQALNFLFLLKNIVRDDLGKEIRQNDLFTELLDFESRIDGLGLLSFDLFLKCREKIYEIRSVELKNRTYRLLKRANVLHELEVEEVETRDNIECLQCPK